MESGEGLAIVGTDLCFVERAFTSDDVECGKTLDSDDICVLFTSPPNSVIVFGMVVVAVDKHAVFSCELAGVVGVGAKEIWGVCGSFIEETSITFGGNVITGDGSNNFSVITADELPQFLSLGTSLTRLLVKFSTVSELLVVFFSDFDITCSILVDGKLRAMGFKNEDDFGLL